MRKYAVILSILLFVAACAAGSAAPQGDIARYTISGAGEGDSSSVSDIWIAADGPEKVDGTPYRWWRLVMRKGDGAILAVKALSERVPMTSASGPGDIARYMYSPKPGTVLEYIDRSTGRALLPELGLNENLLPRPAMDARYPGGFASTGTFLGHLATRARDNSGMPQVDFSNSKRLEIRTDFYIGTSRTFKDDGIVPKPGDNWNFVDWNQDDIHAMIDAGFNYFGTTPTIRPWVENEPVIYRASAAFPDDLYRSNQWTAAMFIDEPMVRMGWTGGIPDRPSGPEMVAQALRLRVASQEMKRSRAISIPNPGTLELHSPPAPSWDTECWTAWYQLQAGAPALVHEGRYVHRGYGYEPEALLGQGLDALTDRDQFNNWYAYMRGAARSFDGDWGTSIYGQSNVDMRLPAMIRAYEMGAKYLWFWTSDHDHHMPFPEQLRLAKGVCDYAKQHPRNREERVRQAEVGIAVPPGYAFNWWGVWGMGREQINPVGVSYGDIAAAALWEGMVCSRKGIEYDFLVDHPGIEKLGYKRLVRVMEDGSLKVTPSWPEKRAPRNLWIEAVPTKGKTIADQQDISPMYTVKRARNMKIDGDFSEWAYADWMDLGKDKWFGDNFETSAKVTISEDAKWRPGSYLGMTYTGINAELIDKYLLEAWPHEELQVITAIEPGSAAEKSGLREGDVILSIDGRQVKFDMHVMQAASRVEAGDKMDVRVRRSGLENYGGDSDLSAETAFMLDDSNLYFAGKVSDDEQHQEREEWWLWANDCVQVAFDPILERQKDNYGENNHEIGFVLKDGKPIAWRWDGRRGQPIGGSKNIEAQIIRGDGTTFYEAAIPLGELAPLAPDTWPRFGANIVINDSDGSENRKGRLELRPGANTRGHHPAQFAVLECEPSGNPRKVSGGILWNKRCMESGGAAEVTLGISSPQTTEAIVRAVLVSLDSPDTKPAVREITIPVSAEPNQYTLRISTDSPAGRYKLKVNARSESGWKVADDALNVYVYPRH